MIVRPQTLRTPAPDRHHEAAKTPARPQPRRPEACAVLLCPRAERLSTESLRTLLQARPAGHRAALARAAEARGQATASFVAHLLRGKSLGQGRPLASQGVRRGVPLVAVMLGGGPAACAELDTGSDDAATLMPRALRAWQRLSRWERASFVEAQSTGAALVDAFDRLAAGGCGVCAPDYRNVLRYLLLALLHGGLSGLAVAARALAYLGHVCLALEPAQLAACDDKVVSVPLLAAPLPPAVTAAASTLSTLAPAPLTVGDGAQARPRLARANQSTPSPFPSSPRLPRSFARPADRAPSARLRQRMQRARLPEQPVPVAAPPWAASLNLGRPASPPLTTQVLPLSSMRTGATPGPRGPAARATSFAGDSAEVHDARVVGASNPASPRFRAPTARRENVLWGRGPAAPGVRFSIAPPANGPFAPLARHRFDRLPGRGSRPSEEQAEAAAALLRLGGR